jgi:hypothetical protein
MSKRKPAKTQEEIRRDLITPYDQAGIPVSDNPRTKRSLQRRVDDTSTRTLKIGLKDIDETIVYYFNNVIKPSVVQNGNTIPVPILYGSPERWSAVQKDGFYRDKNGKIMTPLIMFKRDSVEKNRSLGNKMDANNPQNFQIFEKKYSSKNVYDRFSTLTNREPVKEYYGVVIPDYVNITYRCVIFTDYVEQMNSIIESINYASDSYWGDPEKFKFRAMIDTYATAVELNKGQDRAVKTTFDIKLLGHIIPDSINTVPLGSRRFFSKSRVLFNIEVDGNIETLKAKASTPARQSSRRFFDNSLTGAQNKGMTLDQIVFTSTSNTAIADTVVVNLATFTGKKFLQPPPGFTFTEDSFTVYVNGVSVNPTHVLVQDTGSSITATFNPTLIGYDITSFDTVVITGKLE